MGSMSGVGISNEFDSFNAGKAAAENAVQGLDGKKVDLVIVFSSIRYEAENVLKGIRSVTGNSALIGCTDAGEITSMGPANKSVAVMVLNVKDIEVATGVGRGINKDSKEAGRQLALEVKDDKEENGVLMMFPDGLKGNGADVVRGAQEILGDKIPIVGGSAGDDFIFKETFQFYNDQVLTDSVPGVLLKGNMARGFGVRHGWKKLGMPHKVTKSKGNIIYEIDNKPAVSIYEEYFGKKAEELRSEPLARIAIVYPLGVAAEGVKEPLVRDAISVGEDGSLNCAAEVIEGTDITLMMGSKQEAIEAAKDAAIKAKSSMNGQEIKAVIIFNCIAREKLFGKDAKDEIDAIQEVLGKKTPLIGFYTYGEQAPMENIAGDGTCKTKSHFCNETIVIFTLG